MDIPAIQTALLTFAPMMKVSFYDYSGISSLLFSNKLTHLYRTKVTYLFRAKLTRLFRTKLTPLFRAKLTHPFRTKVTHQSKCLNVVCVWSLTGTEFGFYFFK